MTRKVKHAIWVPDDLVKLLFEFCHDTRPLVKARAVKRQPQEKRWSRALIEAARGLPWHGSDKTLIAPEVGREGQQDAR